MTSRELQIETIKAELAKPGISPYARLTLGKSLQRLQGQAASYGNGIAGCERIASPRINEEPQ